MQGVFLENNYSAWDGILYQKLSGLFPFLWCLKIQTNGPKEIINRHTADRLDIYN